MLSGKKDKTMSSKLIATVPSKSNPSKSYEIKEDAHGSLFCSCPAWRFQRVTPGNNTRVCKHLKSFFAGTLATRKEQPVISKSKAAHLLATAPSKEQAAKEAEARFQAAKKAEKAEKAKAEQMSISFDKAAE